MHGSVSPREAEAMTFDQLCEAHDVLDAIELDREKNDDGK
jgi:hypothetical protein